MAELSCQLGEHVTCSPPKGAKSVVRFDYENNLVCHAQLVIAPMLYRSGTLGGKRVTFSREKWLDTQLMLRSDLITILRFKIICRCWRT